MFAITYIACGFSAHLHSFSYSEFSITAISCKCISSVFFMLSAKNREVIYLKHVITESLKSMFVKLIKSDNLKQKLKVGE